MTVGGGGRGNFPGTFWGVDRSRGMIRFGAAALWALQLSACGLKPGTRQEGEVVEAQGPSVEAARRNAVGSLLDMYVSSATLASAAPELDRSVLAHADRYVSESRVVSEDAGAPARVRALIAPGRLREEIDLMDLENRERLAGARRVMVALKGEAAACLVCGGTQAWKSGGLHEPGACRPAGCASSQLKRGLQRRGFLAWDFSDRRQVPDSAWGGPREAAAGLGADVLVDGDAAAEPVEDRTLAGYHQARGRVRAGASSLLEGRSYGIDVDEQAVAVDITTAGARSRALENAGERAAEELAEGLRKNGWGGTREIAVLIAGLQDLAAARRIISDLRRIPGVRAASLVAQEGPFALLRAHSELEASELAASLLGYKSHGLHPVSVETDFIELEIPRPKKGWWANL